MIVGDRPRRGLRWACALLLGGWLLTTVLVTLTPQPAGTGTGLCVICGERAVADALLNLAFFLPAGLAVACLGLPLGGALLLGVLLSLGIEAAQLALPGRYSSVLDVVSNGSGVALGAALAHVSLPRGRRWTAAALAFLAAAVWIGGWLQVPDAPPEHLTLFVQSRPDPGRDLEPYPGELLSVHAGVDPIGLGSMARGGDLLRRVDRGELPLRLRLRVEPTEGAAAFFGLADGGERHHVLLVARGRDVLYMRRSRSSRLMLNTPWRRASGALADVAPGDTVEITVSGELLTVRAPGRAEGRWSLTLPVARGWSALVHAASMERETEARLDSLWMVLLALPVGWLASSWRQAVVGAILAPAVVAIAGASSPLASAGTWALAACAVGAGSGFVLRSAWLRLKDRAPVGHPAEGLVLESIE